MTKQIRKLKLWWFWNKHLCCDEFSDKLDYLYINSKFRRVPGTEKSDIVEARRQIAHLLDLGDSIDSVLELEKLVERAKL